MAFLKCFLTYAICAIAVVLYQSNYVSGADQCISCNSTSSDSGTKCDNEAVNTTTVTGRCDKGVGECGTYTYKGNDTNNTVYTVRGCDFDCDKLKTSVGAPSDWKCTNCNATLCNVEAISSGASFGISLVSLLLSSIVALYSV